MRHVNRLIVHNVVGYVEISMAQLLAIHNDERERSTTFTTQEQPTILIKRLILQNHTQFNIARLWPVKNSSVAH